ncbi:helix-turn-helix domain-containing protein [Sinorhizobium medicae]|nr:helix-turn-helix domain-containing protein [Sinorhizobium medicae]MDX1014858.1 helix-turn-helix domain-containing protein [Sinorhizobium medicae]
MVSAKEIGSVVKELRRVNRMTQAQLGDAIGRSADAISQIERGVNVPTLETLMALSSGLSVPVDVLLTSKDNSVLHERRKGLRRANAILHALSDKDLGLAIRLLEVLVERAER